MIGLIGSWGDESQTDTSQVRLDGLAPRKNEMQIMKIDPNEKYVLVFPEIDDEVKMQKIVDSLTSFLADDMHTVFFVYGEMAAIVPANQVVGYKVVGKEDNCA